MYAKCKIFYIGGSPMETMNKNPGLLDYWITKRYIYRIPPLAHGAKCLKSLEFLVFSNVLNIQFKIIQSPTRFDYCGLSMTYKCIVGFHCMPIQDFVYYTLINDILFNFNV
jgi:hypothetical protein